MRNTTTEQSVDVTLLADELTGKQGELPMHIEQNHLRKSRQGSDASAVTHFLTRGKASCPKCDSTEVRRIKRNWFEKHCMSQDKYTCKSCSSTFYAKKDGIKVVVF